MFNGVAHRVRSAQYNSKWVCVINFLPPRDHEVRELAGDQVQVAVLSKYFRYILLNLLSQERAQLRLQQVFYPGGERGKSMKIKASINREVTEAGAELSIMRCSLD